METFEGTKMPFVTREQVDEIVKKYPTPFHIYDEKGIKELVGIPQKKRLLIDITIGYSLKPKKPKVRKPKEKVVAYNKYS